MEQKLPTARWARSTRPSRGMIHGSKQAIPAGLVSCPLGDASWAGHVCAAAVRIETGPCCPSRETLAGGYPVATRSGPPNPRHACSSALSLHAGEHRRTGPPPGPMPGRIAAQVLFFQLGDGPADWGRTDLWRSAAAIPGVRVSSDPDGVEAARFGAMTSGHAVVYDPNGRRVFSGGITGSRGHAGENAGRTAILTLVNGENPAKADLPVFGCPMFKPSACGRGDNSCQE